MSEDKYRDGLEMESYPDISPWDRIFLQEMADTFYAKLINRLFWDGHGYMNLIPNQGPWATSDMWSKR